MKTKILALVVAILVVLSFYGIVSAHHPVLVGTPARVYGADAPWTATFTTTVAVADPPVPTTVLTPDERDDLLPATGSSSTFIVVLAALFLGLGAFMITSSKPRFKP